MSHPVRDPALRAKLAALPKIELHRHLEGSLRLTSLLDIANEYNLDLPSRTLEGLRPYVQITDDVPNYSNFLSKFGVLRRFYCSDEVISRLTYEVIEDAARDNVRYMELRFTPAALARTKGFPLHEVVQMVLMAVINARRDFPTIQVELIASFNRHESVAIAETVTQIAVDFKDYIVGLDLAGDEVNYSAEPFAPLFREAQKAGLGLTVHASEWTGPANVRYAIEHLGASRIGHGVRGLEDPSVAAVARERNVAFEVCVTSNFQSGVIQRLQDHPLALMLNFPLQVTINTDDPTVSDITLTDGYEVVADDLGLPLETLHHCILTAARHAFLPEPQRAELVRRFEADLQNKKD